MARPNTVGPASVRAEISVTPGTVTAGTAKVLTVTVPGAKVGQPVVGWAPSLETNLNLGAAWASAANTVKVRVTNPTAADIVGAAQNFYFVQF